MRILDRIIGTDQRPFIIPEVGINHEGDMAKAIRMIDDAAAAGAECVKFQMHVVDDEMAPAAKNVIPGNAQESIWAIMERCTLTEEEHVRLKEHCEKRNILYLCTPFSRKAVDFLERIEVAAYKVGSGECNNYPLLSHIASFGKPVILSTGMNDIASISRSVKILKDAKVDFALLHCTSMYPTPYNKVRLGALHELSDTFKTEIGLSDHSIGNYTSFAATALGASIIEKHFTSDKTWPGPDISISIDPQELADLITGCNAIHEAIGGNKNILLEEKVTIDFAYASVVTIQPIRKGEVFTRDNLWVKRPGTGDILAGEYESILGRVSKCDIEEGVLLRRDCIE
jgi:sialic acid synthase SpsE